MPMLLELDNLIFTYEFSWQDQFIPVDKTATLGCRVTLIHGMFMPAAKATCRELRVVPDSISTCPFSKSNPWGRTYRPALAASWKVI